MGRLLVDSKTLGRLTPSFVSLKVVLAIGGAGVIGIKSSTGCQVTGRQIRHVELNPAEG